MVNCAVIMGRLVADPALRTTASGVSVTLFTVAVDRRFANKDEEKQADFIDIVAWRQTADFVCKYFKKGSMIAVQGNIQTRMYEDKDGNKRKAVEIVADNVSFCGSKSDSNNSAITNVPEPSKTETKGSDGDFKAIGEDDLPF